MSIGRNYTATHEHNTDNNAGSDGPPDNDVNSWIFVPNNALMKKVAISF